MDGFRENNAAIMDCKLFYNNIIGNVQDRLLRVTFPPITELSLLHANSKVMHRE